MLERATSCQKALAPLGEPCCIDRALLHEGSQLRCCSAVPPNPPVPPLALPLQIAAMVSAATLDVPSPLAGCTSMPPAMLSSPSNNKPIGPAAPIAPATAAAPTAPISFSQAVAGGAQANGRRRV